jgi:hypothetical protein
MTTLQRLFTYGGDAQSAPLKSIDIEFTIPVFEYTSVDSADGSSITRNSVATETFSVSHVLDSEDYHIALGDEFAIGRDDRTFALFKQFYWQARLKNSVEDLVVGAAVRYLSGDGEVLGEGAIEFIHFPKLEIDTQIDTPIDMRVARPRTADDPFRKLFIAVNKAALFALQDQLAVAGMVMDEMPLMDAISTLADLKSGQPVFQKRIAEDTQRRLFASLGDNSAEDAPRALEIVKANFPALFDFPLGVAEVQALTIAGTFTIVTPDQSVVAPKDFRFYELSAQFSESGNGALRILHHAFGAGQNIQQNSAPFSFTANQVIFRNSVASLVLVNVKGFDGAPLWTREFKAADPSLANLQIQVPLQKPNTRTPADTALVRDKNKKLRGQVLEFSKKCPLKDLTVMVQVKDGVDMPWRIVGAATTDSAGNFSMPYPFGVFVGAQAVVSAAPAEPATIPVTAVRDGNQTIADDFLYLLVKEIKCPHVGTDEECDCHAKKQAARLPDQADLIESDEYSQDIGGACVNLSTPNRTLSEFNYQALVRTSDPDVANYILKKVEVPQAADAYVFADIARNVAALDAAVSNPIFKTVFVQAALDTAWSQVNFLRGLTAGSSSADLTTALSNVDALISRFHFVPTPNAILNAALDSVVALARELKERLSAALLPRTETHYELEGGRSKRVRKPVDLDNPVAWQDDPDDRKNLSLYQAVTIATGHLLHYKSTFKADGYSLGELIYSLPLAPGQKKEIVVFDSSHTLVGAESQALSQGERLAAGIVNERDITNQLGGSISESLRGSSSANTSGISAGFGTGGSGSGGTPAFGGSGSAVLGVAGGVANANSIAAQDSSRDVSQFFGEKLRQSIMQNAEGYRQLNASVVTTVQEGQRYAVTSEVVANHNHCHALTMMYFEVLRHYAIFQELASVEECVFVPLLMTNFTTQNIYKWRDVLATYLLPMPSETYLQPFSFMRGSGRQHPLLKAFDANERIKTNYANVDFPQGSYDDERIQFIKGDLLLRVDLQRPKTRYDRIKSLPVTTKTVTTREIDPVATAKQAVYDSVAAGASMGFSLLFTGPPGTNIQYTTTETQVQVKQAIFDAFMTMDANYASVSPAQCIRVTNFDPKTISFGGVTVAVMGLDFFQGGDIDRKLWTAYAQILGYADGPSGPAVLQMLDYYFKGRLIAEWDEIFYKDIVPVVFDTIVSSIKITSIATDFTRETRYTGGERLVRLNVNGTTSLKRNQLPLQLTMSCTSPAVLTLSKYVTLTVENMRLLYSTAHYNGTLFSGNISDDLLDETILFIPENAEEKRNPRKEDSYLVYKLIEHLNSNLEHYNKVLWYSLDPDRRYMLLDGFNVQIFNDFGIPAGSRSLASVVKNDLITVTGNSLVFPVAAGYKVSQSYITEETEDPEAQTVRVTLLDHYKPLTPVPPYRISVPSKGVFAEAVQGACNACEKIETERLQDWSRFPNTDEPTAISPVATPVPVITDWKAAFKDFATPIVNIQNAPAVPAPGAGLAGLSELLGKSGVFNDVTGLDANQQNVLKAYLSNQENAKAFAEMAKEMAMQNHNTQNTGKIMDSLKTAKDTGALDQDSYSKLVEDHLQQQIDGGVTKKADLAKQKQSNPSALTKAAVDAAFQGKPVKAQVTDTEGNTESVDIDNQGDGSVSGSGGGGTLKSKIDRALASLLESSTGERPLKLLEGEAADAKAASMILNAQPKKLTDGTEIVPGTVIGGRTMLVDADDALAYYVKDGALWEWGTLRFFRSEYITGQMEAVVGVEPLVRLAYIEIAFLSGLFVGPALIVGSHIVDKGLKLYHYRNQVNAAYQSARKLQAAHDCVKQAVPEMMNKLETKIAWETLKSLPSQFTAKEIAFWLGRCLRGISLIDGELAFASVALAVAKTTAILVLLDTAVNTPGALQAALDEQATLLATELSDDQVTVTDVEARAWLQTLLGNQQARKCMQNLKAALEELTPMLTALRPELVL